MEISKAIGDGLGKGLSVRDASERCDCGQADGRYLTSGPALFDMQTGESYVTGPSEVPDANDWRTEVYWPLEK